MRRSATRQLLLSELDLEHAPDVDAALLGPEEKARHECLKTALLAWWAGTKPKKIEEAYGIKRQSLNYYDKRFFQQHEDGDIQGFRVLRRGTRVDGYVRTKETTQCSVHDGYGTAGAFRQCLKKYPSVKKALDKALQIVAGQDPLSAAINFKDLHRNVFLTALRKAGAPASDYPFCTKTLGYQSVRAYALEVVRNSGASQARLALFGHAALDGWDTGTRKHTWLEPLLPCDLCCYDEQLLPDLGTVSFIVDGTRHVIPMERMSLCLLVSYRPKCILAYHLSMRPRVADADFLETFGNLLTPWVPKTFKATPELSYKPGAGFPNGVVPGFLSAFRIGLLRVDNDMTHYADAVLIYLRARFGMNFEYGKVRRWLTRFAVEQMFAELQVHIAKLASTTGSGPRDRRVNDPVGSALKYEISIEDLRELLEVILANLNGLPRNELYGASALEAMTTAYAPATSVGPALPGYSEDALTRPMPLGIAKVVVHCNEEKSVHPYVEMDGQPYRNDILWEAWHMKGRPMIALLQKDHRKMMLYHADMREFGMVEVGGHWSRSFHDQATRQEILRLRKEGLMAYNAYDDPVQVFRKKKLAEFAEHAKARPGRVMRGSNKFLPTLLGDGSAPPPVPSPTRKIPQQVGRWTQARLDAQRDNEP